MYFFHLLLFMIGGAVAWPELPPNCALVGNWTNYDHTNSIAVWDVTKAIPGETSEFKTYGVEQKHLNVTLSGKSFTRDHRLLGLVLTSIDDTRARFTVLACYNDELWVMQVPLTKNPVSFTRIFTLSKDRTSSKGF